MKKILIFLLTISLFTGCSLFSPAPVIVSVSKPKAPVNEPLQQPIAKPREDKLIQYHYNNAPQFVNNGSCNWRTKDSITCRIKRIQGILGKLENTAVSAIGGIGNCRNCNF